MIACILQGACCNLKLTLEWVWKAVKLCHSLCASSYLQTHTCTPTHPHTCTHTHTQTDTQPTLAVSVSTSAVFSANSAVRSSFYNNSKQKFLLEHPCIPTCSYTYVRTVCTTCFMCPSSLIIPVPFHLLPHQGRQLLVM